MGMHLGKFVHTETGKILMSAILGFGLASLFRTICKNKDCMAFYAPRLEDIKDKIYKTKEKCVKYTYEPTKCDTEHKIVDFE